MPVAQMIPGMGSAPLLQVAALLATASVVLAAERKVVGMVVNFKLKSAGGYRADKMGPASPTPFAQPHA